MKRKKEYNALFVKKEWLDLILSGDKTWEIRGCRCNCIERLGKVLFIESGSGTIVGEGLFVENIGPLSIAEFNRNLDKSHAGRVRAIDKMPYKKTYAWVITKAKRYRKPIRFEQKSGAVIWRKVLL